MATSRQELGASAYIYNLRMMLKHLCTLWLAASLLPTTFAQNPPQKPAPERKTSGTANTKPATPGVPAVPKTPEGIVDFLVPDNLAYPGRLDQVPKADAISALTKAQPNAVGQRADSITFLLVLLGTDVDANRQRLINSLRACRQEEDCNDQVIEYLGHLYSRGDKLVLDPLLDAAPKADAIVAEGLGSTFDDMIAADARPFVTALARRPPPQQREVCKLVAAADGGGMPEDTSSQVQQALTSLAREVGPTAVAAMTCLNEVRAFVPSK
jgi:hypothetical protein